MTDADETMNEYWAVSIDNINAIIQGMRTMSEDKTPEEKVCLDECSRNLSEISRMIFARKKARRMGAEGCPNCGGEPMLRAEVGIGLSRPYMECQVCGNRLTIRDLGMFDSELPQNRYLKAEEVLVKAWNARGGRTDEESGRKGE